MNSSVLHPTFCVSWSESDKRYVGLCIEFPELQWMDEIPEVALAGIRSLVSDHKQNASLAKLYEIQHVFDDEFFVFQPVDGFTQLMRSLNDEHYSKG